MSPKTSETIETLLNHVSIRDFSDQPIDDETLTQLLESARRSPTSSNLQSYSMVVVRDPETKKKISVIANNQKHIITAPVFVALCADISRHKLVCEMHEKPFDPGLESAMVAIVDAAIVGMSLTVAAESLGLGAVMIGAMRNDPIAAAELLNLPEGVFVVYGFSVGWPASRPPQKPRLPANVVIHHEQYSTDGLEDKLKAHDAELAVHYRSLGRETPDAAWTANTARVAGHNRRPFLKSVLEQLGFNLE